MAHLKLPPCKVGLSFNMGILLHVLMKPKNCDEPPQHRSLQTGTHNLSSETLENDRQDLLKIPTKNNDKTTKGLIRVTQISKSAIHYLYNVLMLN
jgi:hypothetical protein